MVDSTCVRLSGPLAAHREGLWTNLLARGYTPLSSRNLLHVLAHLSRWMASNDLRPEKLKPERIKEFLRHRRKAGYTHHLSRRGLDAVLGYLRGADAIPKPDESAVGQSQIDRLLHQYENYLKQERALVGTTIGGYLRVARRFLSRRADAGAVSLDQLSAVDVTSFVVEESRRWSVGTCKLMVTALRSLLRYLHVQGELGTALAEAVPAVASWRLSGLPKALAPGDVQRLLRTCDRRTHVGRRNYAVLLLLVRLGLRANEVASLNLDDIAWDRGEIVIRGKGGREDCLPLPQDVGEAVASYLQRSRPRTDSGRIFVQARAPFRNFGRSTVTTIVRAAGARIGHTPLGAHRLRHTAATQMLCQGSSLYQIAQVLRHRSVETTAIYAKVDREALRQLCRAWPGGGSC